ncbi:polysaccharide deacetylase family protein [uncultured Bacteroides sp.]|uniref:polysaccharide deacetylase family protein n=1 Tax=uncultured Bacteroides sp. TaxID=162156 RepID=UPI002AAB6CFC|nr:polysaccharide deacetylase family protein [uncultured Bacteroides sp.]
MIIVFAHKKSPRLNYILSRIFSDILGVEACLTTDKNEFIASDLPSVNYSGENLNKGLWIIPHTLLYSKGINKQKIEKIARWKNLPVFFSQEQGAIPFDLFAASFYLITRYEEYHSTALDSHGRYQYTDSIISKMDCIEEPVVDQWAYALKQELLRLYPQCKFTCRSFRFIPTIDIDHPYLYRNKGFALNALCLLKDLFERKFSVFRDRLLTILHLKEDTYFNFEYLLQLYQEQDIKGLFFVHRGPYGKFDRRYIYPSRRYRKMLRQISEKHSVFIHPSYIAAFNNLQFCKEKMELEMILEKKVEGSRQHFLRFRFPETFRQLLAADIHDDYSVLYSSQFGFRAGTSIPFPFYDIEKEQETSLIIHPSAVMDVTLHRDFGMTSQETLEKIQELAEKVKAVNGDLITLFHNSSLAETAEWKGWKETYTEMIKQIK